MKSLAIKVLSKSSAKLYPTPKRLPGKKQVARDISGLEEPQSFIDLVYIQSTDNCEMKIRTRCLH
jgi:hypothetical protein